MNTSFVFTSMVGATLLLASCYMPMMGGRPQARFARQYGSNGEQIYFTSASQRGDPISFQMAGGGMMGGMRMTGGMMACVDCHSADGRGGRVQMMMTTFVAPDIRYQALTAEQMEHGAEQGDEEEEHPPYTDETIKQAITQGVDPAGNPLAWPMPRWSMSEADLNDLVAFLKTLE